ASSMTGNFVDGRRFCLEALAVAAAVPTRPQCLMVLRETVSLGDNNHPVFGNGEATPIRLSIDAHLLIWRNLHALVNDTAAQHRSSPHRDAIEQQSILHNSVFVDPDPGKQNRMANVATGDDGTAADNGVDKPPFVA